MTASFRQLTDQVYAAPQIGLGEVAEAASAGFGLIINNRPEDESDDQIPGAEIEAEAKAAGLAYVAIPVTHAGFSQPQIAAMAAALASTDKPVLAYCRSGTRSTCSGPWPKRAGAKPAQPRRRAAQAGYDLGPVRAMLDMLATREG